MKTWIPLAALLLPACSGSDTKLVAASTTEPASAPAMDTEPGLAKDLLFQAPATWTAETPSSGMRVGQYSLPGDDGPASLVIYWFAGGGGTVEANIARWVGQFQSPEGGEVEPASESTSERDGLTFHELELYGTYVAEVRPGAPDRHNEPGWGLLAAVVVTPKGPYYVKVVGPEQTVRAHKQGLALMLESVRFQD